MTDPEVFLSYRSTDHAALVAQTLHQRLGDALGEQAVFLAHKSIKLGRRWEERIMTVLQDCTVVLVLIGRAWAGADAAGGRRIDDPDDFVHREVKMALDLDKFVVPVRVDRSRLTVADVPDALSGLLGRQDIELRLRSFPEDCDRLERQLRVSVPSLFPVPRPSVGPAARDLPPAPAAQPAQATYQDSSVHNEFGSVSTTHFHAGNVVNPRSDR